MNKLFFRLSTKNKLLRFRRSKIILSLLVFLFFLTSVGVSQVKYTKTNSDFIETLFNKTYINNTPAYTLDSRAIEKEVARILHSEDKLDTPKPFIFGVNNIVNLNTQNSGKWFNDGDNKIWILKIKSEGALSLNLVFDDLKTPQHSELYIFNGRKNLICGPVKNRVSLGTTTFEGDEIIVIYSTRTDDTTVPKINLKNIIHGFRNSTASSSPYRGPGCYEDPYCLSNMEDYSNSVAKIIMGNTACSCTLVNNTAENKKPYILTAKHCVDDYPFDIDPNTFVYQFKYRKTACDGTSYDNIYTATGSSLLKLYSPADAALLELNESLPGCEDFYYSGWNRNTSLNGLFFNISHPVGIEQKVTRANHPIQLPTDPLNTNMVLANLSFGGFEHGSSGSSLIDENGLIVGGSATLGLNRPCGPNLQAQFSKFSVTFNQFKQWLDPLNINPTTLNGTYGCCGTGNDMVINSSALLYFENLDIGGNIIVEPGAHLQIVNSILKFGENKRIIVKRGAKLTVANSTLTRCDAADDWRGITVEGNSNLQQPNQNSMPTANQAGIVRVINHSIIEWARTAISTNYYGPWTNQKWGGLVYCNNVTFRNNARAAEFMKYDFTNKSKFINCTFDGNSTISGNTTGVTIWDTDGIEFNDCNFYNMESEGILAYDSGVTVINGNKFYHNYKGINSKATFPFSSYLTIGSSNTNRNDFANNTYHIYSYANAQRDGLNIGFNDFDHSYKAIYLYGPSKYSIFANNINHSIFGVYANRTGSMGNTTSNKSIISNNISTSNGIYCKYENHGLKFTCNDFDCHSDFILRGSSWIPGTIHSNQGSYWSPAGNCFTRPIVNGDIRTLGTTTSFNYRYYNTNCQNPQTTGNYTKSNSWHPPCQFSVAVSNQSYSYNDLEKVRKEIENLKKEGKSEKLGELLDKKDEILSSVVWDYVDAQKIDKAIKTLDSEKTDNAELMKYGIYVNSGKLKNAERQLRVLPKSIVDLDDFVGVQQINLERLQKENYQMAKSDSLYLEKIAISNSASDIYARSILGLLFGREFEDKFEDEEEINEKDAMFRLSKTDKKDMRFSIQPNPINEQFSISVSDQYINQQLTVEVFDIVGHRVYSKPSINTRDIEINSLEWNSGVYLLRISNAGGKQIFNSKIIK